MYKNKDWLFLKNRSDRYMSLSELASILKIDESVLFNWRINKINIPLKELESTYGKYKIGHIVCDIYLVYLFLLKCLSHTSFEKASDVFRKKIQYAITEISDRMRFKKILRYLMRKQKINGIKIFTLNYKLWDVQEEQDDITLKLNT